MDDKNKFQAMLQLAEFGVKRMEERRSVEFRIFISYITLLVLALYQLVKQGNPIREFFELFIQKDAISLELWEGIILYVFGLIIHTVYVMWQVGISIAMDNDAYRRNFYLRAAETISGRPLEYDHKNPNSDEKIVIIENYLQQFCYLRVIWTDWSRMLLVVIPKILFIIVVNLFIKKFNSDITICVRILLSVIPILVLLLLIPVGFWVDKRIKKNSE